MASRILVCRGNCRKSHSIPALKSRAIPSWHVACFMGERTQKPTFNNASITMKKIVSAILVVMSCALSGCMAEPMDSTEIENELNAEAREVSIDGDDVMVEETNLTGSCPLNYRAAIATYYWTTKPLCNTQPIVYCAVERLIDSQTPCRFGPCHDYVLHCNQDTTQY
jgi:hypothetical protein